MSQRIFKYQFGISEQSSIRFRGQIHDPSGAVRFADTLGGTFEGGNINVTKFMNSIISCTRCCDIYHVLSIFMSCPLNPVIRKSAQGRLMSSLNFVVTIAHFFMHFMKLKFLRILNFREKEKGMIKNLKGD